MEHNTTKMILLFLLFATLITGCLPKVDTPVVPYNPYRGSTGFAMSFIENAPPPKVYGNQDFKIGMKISNEGAFDIVNGKVILQYIQEDLSSVSSAEQTINLYGRNTQIKQGESDVLFWDARAANIIKIEDERTTNIWAIAVYKYRTNGFNDVCVDPDVYGSHINTKTCQASESVAFESQGAPIAITHVQMNLIPESESSGKLDFTITVKNVGGGEVYGGSSASSPGDFNIVNIRGELSGDSLSCKQPRILLEHGVGETLCSGSYSGKTKEYTTPLHIQLDYVYKDISHTQGTYILANI